MGSSTAVEIKCRCGRRYEVAGVDWSSEWLRIADYNSKRPRLPSHVLAVTVPKDRSRVEAVRGDRWEYACPCGANPTVTASAIKAAVDHARDRGRTSITIQYEVNGEGKVERPEGYGSLPLRIIE